MSKFFILWRNLEGRDKDIILFITLLAIKLLMVVVINLISWSDSFSLYTPIGDDGQYIGYSENLFNEGEYYFEFSDNGYKDPTFRMPGMTFIYLPFRILFSKFWTLNLIVLFQIIFSTYSFFMFYKHLKELIYKKIHFVLIGLFSFYLYSAYLDSSLMTESLSLSCLMLTIVVLKKIKQFGGCKYVIYGGLLLTWLIFLRPYMFPFLLIYTVYVWLSTRSIKYMLLFLTPFLIIDTSWFIRNSINHKQAVFLQTSDSWFKNANKSLEAKINFIKCFGFGWVNFEESSESTWFNNASEAPSVKIPDNSIFPSRTFIGGMTIDSLVLARDLMHKVVNVNLNEDERVNADRESARILNKFILKLKLENPLDYYLLNRFRLVLSFLSPNVPKLFIHAPYPFNKIFSLSHIFLSLIIKYIGFLGLIILFFKSFKNIDILFLILSLPFYIIFLFPIYFQIDETRFFYLALPFLVIGVLTFLDYMRLINLLFLIVLLIFLSIFQLNFYF